MLRLPDCEGDFEKQGIQWDFHQDTSSYFEVGQLEEGNDICWTCLHSESVGCSDSGHC